MTARAAISQAELKRMATVAKAEGVSIEIETGGKKIRVIPATADAEKVDKTKEIPL